MKSYFAKGLVVLMAVASVSAVTAPAFAAGSTGHYHGVRHGKRTVCHWVHGHRHCRWID
jgi:hypothetical protein